MKVLMLLFKDVLYDARVQREALALAEIGHKVDIFCLNEYDTDIHSIHENIRIIKFNITTKKVKQKVLNREKNEQAKIKLNFRKVLVKFVRTPIIKLLKDILAYKQFYTLCRNHILKTSSNYDVIHCHDLNTLSTGAKLAKILNSKIIYDSHELFNEMAGRNQIDRIYGYWLEKRLIKVVNHVIVVNPYVKEEFKKMYGDDLPVTIIQNTPINTLKLYPNEKVEDLRVKYSISKEDIVLIYQGGINPHRGLELIFRALPLLPETYKLILMGSGRIVDFLKNLALSLNISSRVFFHPQVPASKVLHYTKQADIGLVMYENTSRNNYLSTPNKVFEYMLAGIPTIASNHPGKRYVVEEEETGICTDENPEAIARVILEIMNNYEKYVKNCQQKSKYYTWEYEKRKLQDLYLRGIE